MKNMMCMGTNTKLRQGQLWQMLLVVLFTCLMPQEAWAEDKLETQVVGDKQYYVLRSADDWEKFRQLVIDAAGKKDVNAIMDNNISAPKNSCVGMDAYPYNGTFNGNGHTLTVDVNWGDDAFAAPFPSVGNATFKNLTIKGKVIGGEHPGGLVGHAFGTTQSITLENFISKVSVSGGIHTGGIVGHAQEAKLTVIDVLSIGSIWSSGTDTYGGSIIGWANNANDWTFHRVWESVTFNRTEHCGFCYYYKGEVKAWGYNNQSSNCISYHSGWGEMKEDCRNKGLDTATEIFNKELPGSWSAYSFNPIMET